MTASPLRILASCVLLLLLVGCAQNKPTEPAGGGTVEKSHDDKEKPKLAQSVPPSAKAEVSKETPKAAEVVFKSLGDREFTYYKEEQISSSLKHNLEFCAFSPDSKRLLLVDSSGGIELLESGSWKSLKAFADSEAFKVSIPPVSVAVSPDFKRLVFGCSDKTVHVWNLEKGKEERRLEGHPDWVRCMAFSPDSKRLVTGTNDPTLFVWDIETGNLIKKFPHGFGLAWCIAFTPDGKELLVPIYPQMQRLDPQTGAELGKQKVHNWAKTMAFSPDGKLLAYDGNPNDKPFDVNVWNRETGTVFTVPGFQGEERSAGVTEVAFISNNLLAVHGFNGGEQKLRIWDLNEHRQLSNIGMWGKFAVSPDGKFLMYQAGGALPDLLLRVVDLPAELKGK